MQPRVQTFNERVNGGPIRAVFLSLMGAVGFVLLIACANVANLLLARSAQRSREIAVRVSIGATRWRIVRQLLMESLLLALISGVLGFGLSLIGIRLFDAATQDVGKPYWIQFTMDGSVFAYLAAICLGTGVLFGLAPALHVSKTDVNEILKEGGRSGAAGIRVRRWTGGLIIAELALTLALLAGAGFMMRNFLTLYQLDLGIDTSRLVTMSLALPERKYPAIEQRLAFYERLQERLAANGRIRSVTVASNVPMQGGFARRLAVDGRPLADGEQPPMVTMLTVDPRYFETLGLPLLRGRGFTAADGTAGQESTIINARFAQMFFANEDPIGRRIVLSMDLAGDAAPDEHPDVADGDDRGHRAQRQTARYRGGRDRPGGLYALPQRSTRFHDAAGTQRGRSVGSDVAAARGSSRHRRRSAALQHSHHGPEPGHATLAIPGVRDHVRDFRAHCPDVVGGRPIRGHGVLSDPADAGDWRTHGSRR